ADQRVGVGILARGAGGGEERADPQAVHPTPERWSVDAVAVPEEIARRRILWEGVDDLLCGPRGSGVCGDVQVDDAASVVRQDYAHEQHLERGGRHGEEVGGHEVAGMVPQERTPGGRWRVALPDPVLGDRGRRDLDAELPQLAIDARRPPEWIGPADLPDQRPDVWIDRGSS